eukprot:gene24865-31254_t
MTLKSAMTYLKTYQDLTRSVLQNTVHKHIIKKPFIITEDSTSSDESLHSSHIKTSVQYNKKVLRDSLFKVETLKTQNTVPLIVKHILQEYAADSLDTLLYSMKTVRGWLNEFMSQGGFLEDGRGSYERAMRFGSGQLTYYNDRHDAPENVKYRNESYLVDCELFSRREACWVSVPLTKCTAAALKHVCRVRGLQDVSQLPTSTDSNALDSTFVCKYGHNARVCKCYLPVVRIGQDEAVFKQNALSKRAWAINGIQELRPKNDGPGEMESAVQDEYRGFGFPMSKAELKTAKQLMADAGICTRNKLKATPGVVNLETGS